MPSFYPRGVAICAGLFVFTFTARAWDYAGHRMVNQVALAALPSDFPSFVREADAAERVAFLSGEPDRWRNVSDLPLKHVNGSDHYLDVEDLPRAGLDASTVSSMRYDFVTAFATGRAAHAANFPTIDPAKNVEHSREWPGFAPWAIVEYYGKVKSQFSYLKAYEENGTPEEIANAKADLIYVMGVMGHYVGDLAQPLHTTEHHNGWVGDNPHGYTQATTIHSWIDGGFIAKAHISYADIAPRVTPAALIRVEPRSDGRDPVFVAIMDYFLAQHTLVEPLYQLEKAGKFNPDLGDVTEGRAFIEGQIQKGGEMLASLWLTAWRNAGPDVFLRTQLLKRKASTPAK
jgi:hypothetical protein